MKKTVHFGISTAVCIVGAGSMLLLQGCRSTRPVSGPPPEPPMPPPALAPTEPLPAVPPPPKVHVQSTEPLYVPPTVTHHKKVTTKTSAKEVSGATYVVKSGDSLSKIASRNKTSVAALKKANALKSDVIRTGQKLVIPGGKVEAPKPSSAKKTETSAKPAASLPTSNLDSAPVGVAPAKPQEPEGAPAAAGSPKPAPLPATEKP